MEKYVLVIALALWNITALAQEVQVKEEVHNLYKHLMWANAGIGAYSNYSNARHGGGSLHLDINITRYRHQYKALLGLHHEYNSQTSTPTNILLELGGLMGPSLHTRHIHFAVLGGLSMVYYMGRGDKEINTGWSITEYESENEFGVGLPIKVELDYITSNTFGLGISLFTNVNTIRSIYGIEGRISFGSLRR